MMYEEESRICQELMGINYSEKVYFKLVEFRKWFFGLDTTIATNKHFDKQLVDLLSAVLEFSSEPKP